MPQKLTIRSKRLKGCDGNRVFSVRIQEDLVLALDKISAQTGHSRNELINLFIAYALENCEID